MKIVMWFNPFYIIISEGWSPGMMAHEFSLRNFKPIQKSVNLQFNTVGRWDDDMIVPPSDGPMIIWID